MKAGQSFRCLFWAVLYCVLYLVTAAEEDLVDFDFSDLKEIDWNYDNDNPSSSEMSSSTVSDKKLSSNMVSFDDDEDMEENQVHPFDWREKILRTALSKALTNVALRQKFVEVMPILRVLSSQQRLALSALISAQINAKKGQELKLEQVRMMFGDDKKLLIPIVYDIANLVRNSARKYLQFDYDEVSPELLQTPIDRRHFDLTSQEANEEETIKDIGTIPTSSAYNSDSSLEDFMADMPKDVLDPQSINEELQAGSTMPTRTMTNSTTETTKRPKRHRRATEFIHKLIRSIPLSVNEDDLVKGSAGQTIKLNTTAFRGPQESELYGRGVAPVTYTATNAIISTSSAAPPPVSPSIADPLSYHEIEDLAFASLNGSELTFSTDSALTTEIESDNDEALPTPEELIAGPRYRTNHNGAANKLHLMRPKVAAKRKRVQVRARPKGPTPVAAPAQSAKKCERFTASMCIRTDDYPLEQIMGSIRRHKNAMTALLAEYHDRPATYDLLDDFEDFSYSKKRREDEVTGGGMCQSIVRYARPQKARSASGEWKYIVNTGQHTQTLRLEKCTNPQESCSYLAHNYRSHCSQVYNYHRLLSWDKMRGLHVDIFKVPTCCSCQIDGYRQQYPPLDNIKAKDYMHSFNADIYSTINDDLDYNDEDDEDDLDYRRHHGRGQHKSDASYNENELLLGGSNKVRTKVFSPNPTVGSYLSPPGSDEYDSQFSYKGQRGTSSSLLPLSSLSSSSSSNSLLGHLPRRRPYKSLSATNEARVDLDQAPSELHTEKEVNLLGPTHVNDKTRVPQKRKRIYSVPHTATSSVTTSAASTVTAAVPPAVGPTRGSSSAAHAHQAPAAHPNPTYYTNANNAIIRSSGGGVGIGSSGSKSKPRHYAIPTVTSTPTTASPPTTESTYRFRPSSSSYSSTSSTTSTSVLPPIYHVNSIYSAKYNSSGAGGGGGIASSVPKRINYSYHPIIDFFENNNKQRSSNGISSATEASSSSEESINQEQLYPHKILKVTSSDNGMRYDNSRYQSHERRIGFGAGGGYSAADNNAWHPVVVAQQI